jgi:hypothetical protein
MQVRRTDMSTSLRAASEIASAELCRCLPPSLPASLLMSSAQQEELEGSDPEQVTPVSAQLYIVLRSCLETFFPRATPLSLILLHISQLEQVQFVPYGATIKRQRQHAPASLLEQVLANIRRTIRSSDLILTDEGAGAALIFPEVDEHGIYGILERIYRGISLLQAETVIPPLRRETNIALGAATYPHPAATVEQVLHYASVTARRLNLRPVIMTPTWEAQYSSNSSNGSSEHDQAAAFSPVRALEIDTEERIPVAPPVRPLGRAPYMELPTRVPPRLRQLVPHTLAAELQCAPVGRDHLCLTVAMADPQDARSVRSLESATGLTIFPVSCDIAALQALLDEKW